MLKESYKPLSRMALSGINMLDLPAVHNPPVCLCPSGQWRVFSGNELGALLGWWLFSCWKNQNPEAARLKTIYMLSSTVSSKILRAIALKEGFHFEVTTPSKTLNQFSVLKTVTHDVLRTSDKSL